MTGQEYLIKMQRLTADEKIAVRVVMDSVNYGRLTAETIGLLASCDIQAVEKILLDIAENDPQFSRVRQTAELLSRDNIRARARDLLDSMNDEQVTELSARLKGREV